MGLLPVLVMAFQTLGCQEAWALYLWDLVLAEKGRGWAFGDDTTVLTSVNAAVRHRVESSQRPWQGHSAQDREDSGRETEGLMPDLPTDRALCFAPLP